MMDTEHDVVTDPLFVGLTRPTTIWGVPFVAFWIEYMVVMVTFLAVGDPFYLLIVIPIHAVMYLISAHDPGIFTSIAIWFITIGKSRNTRFWGAASFSPLSTKKWVK
jgi:type IV secretion system protein VirB3